MNERLRLMATRLRRDERGLTTVEYVIVLCLIAIAAVTTWDRFGSNIAGYLENADRDIGAAMAPNE